MRGARAACARFARCTLWVRVTRVSDRKVCSRARDPNHINSLASRGRKLHYKTWRDAGEATGSLCGRETAIRSRATSTCALWSWKKSSAPTLTTLTRLPRLPVVHTRPAGGAFTLVSVPRRPRALFAASPAPHLSALAKRAPRARSRGGALPRRVGVLRGRGDLDDDGRRLRVLQTARRPRHGPRRRGRGGWGEHVCSREERRKRGTTRAARQGECGERAACAAWRLRAHIHPRKT